MVKALFYILFISSILALSAQASDLDVHPGYLISVEGERYQLSREVIITPDTVVDRMSLSERIFTDKLTKDFQTRYEDQFGRTQGEQLDSIPMRFYEKELKPGVYVTEEAYVEKQQKFGKYMAKRLAEYHIDSYLRENPSARPVLELKEKVSNVDLTVKKGYKVKLKYSLSGNYLDVNIDNPYNVGAKVTLESFGSADIITALSYPVTKTVTMIADYRKEMDQSTLSATKTITSKLSASITALSNNLENKGLIGMTWFD